MNTIYNIVSKIGKRNVMLILFIVSVLIISGLYSTFSLTTFSEGVSVVDGVKTLKFVLGRVEDENSIMIAGGSTKSIAITVSNDDDIDLKYGIYYSSLDDLSDVDLGYYHSTEHLPVGVISAKSDYVVTISIENKSDDVKTINFGIVYGLKDGGDLVLDEFQYFMDQKWNFPLSEVEKGSYVSYRGNNGCALEFCDGGNANYVEEVQDGYCDNEKNTYHDSGWRVAYVKNDSAYLISAGAPECLQITKDNEKDFSKLLSDTAINYCNLDYAYDGVCNNKTAWPMSDRDFYYMIGHKLNNESCYEYKDSNVCGFNNSLLDIGGFYWVNYLVNNHYLYYNSNESYYTVSNDDVMKGIRPVVRLSDAVVVVRGKGTKEEPYQIKNNKVADYEYTVVYNGNGATSGDVQNSIHHTNISQKLNKNMFSLEYQIKEDEFANFDDSYCDGDTCHEASVHVDYSGVKNATFLGWSFYPDDDKAMYLDEQEVVNLSLSSEEVFVNLYAVWRYDVFILPEIQMRDGYEIIGWYTEKDGGEKVGNPGDKYTSIGNKTLYARWEKINS